MTKQIGAPAGAPLGKAQASSDSDPIYNTARVTYSRGRGTYDNCPEARSATTFKEFRDAVFSDRGEKKGEQYIATQFDSGPHPRDGDKFSGEKGWRCSAYARPRRWVSMDLDGCPSAEAFMALQQVCSHFSCFGYTTASHTPKSPRARLIFELTAMLHECCWSDQLF
jgi:hypothetical protein